MTLTEDLSEKPLISHYSNEVIRINEKDYKTNILILPSGEILNWPIQELEDLTQAHCVEMINYRPEVVIIGTGSSHKLPDLNIVRHFADYKMGVEIMNTAAACRTYNVLVLEGRQVIAGLII